MAFEIGHQKKGGRIKGIPNKTTKYIRDLLKDALQGEIERISEHFNRISCPKERLDTLAKFLPYITPKIQALKLTDNQPKIDKIKIEVIDTGLD
tara:strand:+ start:545 stop:826 length:282 start_codon:yes stop_codon:yes gene_type:complete